MGNFQIAMLFIFSTSFTKEWEKDQKKTVRFILMDWNDKLIIILVSLSCYILP